MGKTKSIKQATELQSMVVEYVENWSELFPAYNYAREKLGSAVYKLATGVNVIKARLADAFIEIAILQEDDLPQGLRAEWRAIRNELTKGKMQYETVIRDGALDTRPIGRLYSTLRFMRLEKAQRIAERICNLEYRLREYSNESSDGQE